MHPRLPLDRFQEELLTRSGFDTDAKRTLRTRVLDAIYPDAALWERCWAFTDAYGEPGFEPAQGLDWSGFRDSTYDAIQQMADALGIE